MLEQLKTKMRFENDGEKSRLVLEMDGNIPVIEFQVDMVRNNQIPGLLPLEMRRADDKTQLYYDVTGKWRLKDILDNREFSGSEFTALVEKFIQTLIGSEAYLLDLSQFVMDEEHIFLDGKMEPLLIYLPVRGAQNIHERFKDMLMQLIVYRARLKDQDSGPLLSGILNYLKRDHFNLYEFEKALRTLNSNVPSQSPAVKPKPLHQSEDPKSLGNLISQNNQQLPPNSSKFKAVPEKIKSTHVPLVPQDKIRLKSETEGKKKMKYKASVVISVLVFQVVMVIGVLVGFGPVYEATEDLATTYASMALLVVCLDGLVLKNLLKTENRIKVKIPMKRRLLAAEESDSLEIPVFPVNFDKQVISNAPIGVPKSVAYDTELLYPKAVSDSPSYDTVVLSTQPAAPYLVRKGPVQEIIRLKQSTLVLGRQGDMADHVICDSAIGRMHAELSWVNNLCQIRDLNSKNGTFVNGQRLAGPQPVSLFIGDEVKLGPLEYTLAQD